jgi:hypothetical protein
LKHPTDVGREPVTLDLGITVVKDANDAGSGSVKRPRKLLKTQTVALRKLEQPRTLASSLRQFRGIIRRSNGVGLWNHLKVRVIKSPKAEVKRRKL